MNREILNRTLSDEDIGRIKNAAQGMGYTDLDVIDKGGAAFVFSATQSDGRKVALKLLQPPYDEKWLRRFRQEAEVLSRLSHPHLVQVFPPGLQEVANYTMFSMEYVDGISFKRYLTDQGPLEEKWHYGFFVE